jgi:hypothetical protein
MNPSPKEVAETLLEGGRIAHTLSTEHLEDVIFHIQRKLDGETGYKLLISEKVRPASSSLALATNDSLYDF